MRASGVAALGKMKTCCGEPCPDSSVYFETESEGGASVDCLAVDLADLVRGMTAAECLVFLKGGGRIVSKVLRNFYVQDVCARPRKWFRDIQHRESDPITRDL